MSTLNDHGLEVIRKSGEEVTPGNKSDYYLKVGPTPGHPIPVTLSGGSVTVLGDSITSGTVDGTDTGTERTFVNNYRQQVMSSHDLVPTYVWLDFGNKNERISTITYTSATFPGVTVVQTYNYTLVGGAYRLDSAPFVTTPGG